MKKAIVSCFLTLLLCCFIASCAVAPRQAKAPEPYRIGYSVGITGITPEKMAYAKSVGIDYVETSLRVFIDDNRNFTVREEEIMEALKKAKAAADQAGIVIWSIHMPFGKHIDISLADEEERQKVVALHRKVLEFASILQPRVILFHPSFYLGLNERETRKNQMIKSSRELLKAVQDIKATMVIENMLGPALLVDANRERPLCRTVEETVEIMNRLPADIYAAVDMNHIKHPENLIRAMGTRLRSVHIADGHGEAENHYFPCSGKGGNNWTEILAALHEAKYSGPFMFESAHEDVKDLKPCYQSMYEAFVKEKGLQPLK
jgi:sugar phosphate isomerase/epimerase